MLARSSGECKLSDFGLTSSVDAAGGRDSFVGTTVYMAPERIMGSEYSFPSDIWSIGMSLVYMATGSSPIDTADGYWGILDLVNSDFDPKLDPTQYSANLIDFTKQCLYKDQAQRWTTKQLLQHPFITTGPATIEETLPHWPKQLNMGAEAVAPDLSQYVKAWKIKQMNRKATLNLKKQGLRGTIITHKVYADGAEEPDEGGIVMLPQSLTPMDDDFEHAMTARWMSSHRSYDKTCSHKRMPV
jgi:serine/threonine protein kinase